MSICETLSLFSASAHPTCPITGVEGGTGSYSKIFPSATLVSHVDTGYASPPSSTATMSANEARYNVLDWQPPLSPYSPFAEWIGVRIIVVARPDQRGHFEALKGILVIVRDASFSSTQLSGPAIWVDVKGHTDQSVRPIDMADVCAINFLRRRDLELHGASLPPGIPLALALTILQGDVFEHTAIFPRDCGVVPRTSHTKSNDRSSVVWKSAFKILAPIAGEYIWNRILRAGRMPDRGNPN
jgi:hypothetical protein